MTEQICPACGCTIAGPGVEKEGQVYCCQPCAEGSSNQCHCGCCEAADEEQKGR